jgi:hypothetical protein
MSQARTTEILENQMGKGGLEIVVDTVERTGSFVSLIVTSAVVLTSLTPKVALSVGSDGFGDLTTLPLGKYDFEFTAIKLASGEAMLVKG